MRKLLIMASLFPPQKNGGGPTVSIMNIVQAIKGQFDISVISHHHEVGDDKPLEGVSAGWNTFDFGKVYYSPYGQHGVSDNLRRIEEVQPDVIYQNSFFSYDDVLAVLKYKKKHPEVAVVIAPRGEICENRFHSKHGKKALYTKVLKWSGLLKGVYWQATGADELADMMKYLGVKRDRIYDINNFSHASDEDIVPIKKRPGELKLCYIARIQDTKNLLYAVQRLQNVGGFITYDVYGPIENKEYYDRCFAVPLPENVELRYRGSVDHENVGKTVSQYHAYYMPTIGENYGHSIVEALLHKRPAVISNMTPWNGLNEAGGGYAIPLDEPERFEAAIEELCAMEQAQFDAVCAQAKAFIEEQLHVDTIVQQYVDCFNEV